MTIRHVVDLIVFYAFPWIPKVSYFGILGWNTAETAKRTFIGIPISNNFYKILSFFGISMEFLGWIPSEFLYLNPKNLFLCSCNIQNHWLNTLQNWFQSLLLLEIDRIYHRFFRERAVLNRIEWKNFAVGQNLFPPNGNIRDFFQNPILSQWRLKYFNLISFVVHT